MLLALSSQLLPAHNALSAQPGHALHVTSINLELMRILLHVNLSREATIIPQHVLGMPAEMPEALRIPALLARLLAGLMQAGHAAAPLGQAQVRASAGSQLLALETRHALPGRRGVSLAVPMLCHYLDPGCSDTCKKRPMLSDDRCLMYHWHLLKAALCHLEANEAVMRTRSALSDAPELPSGGM